MMKGSIAVRTLRSSLLIVAAIAITPHALAKPKPTIQITLVAHNETFYGTFTGFTVYLIMPDGTHAKATGSAALGTYALEPFAPEKRRTVACVESSTSRSAKCEKDEVYSAIRNGNAIAIFGAAGPVVFHIDGTWDSFTEEQPAKSTTWTAICNDDTIDYSPYRAGACAEHHGVRLLRVPY